MRVIGVVFRHLGSVGVVSGINPIGTVKFLYGNEMNQKTIDVKLKNLKPVDFTDLTKVIIEKEVQRLSLEELSDRGVSFSNISLNVNFTPQTEEALDVISALEFYKTKGEEDLGRKVIIAKAGSAKISSSTGGQ